MDVAKLPIDTDAMLTGLRPWVECESPTWDAMRVGAMLSTSFHSSGDSVLGENVHSCEIRS